MSTRKRASKLSPRIAASVTAFFLLKLASVHALTWDPGDTTNADGIDPGSGNWDLTTAIWNNASSDVVWSQTSATAGTNFAIFSGADGTYAVNVTTGIGATGLQFQNSGYTLSATTAQAITLANSGSQTIVAAGKTANIGNNVTVTYTNTALINGGGTLNIGGGTAAARVQITAANTLAIGGAGTLVDVKTNGTLAHTSGTTAKFAIATATGDDTTVQIDGGTVSVAGNNTTSVYQLSSGTGAGSNGTLTINSGTFIINAAQVNQGLATAVNAVDTATINLNGGLMTVPKLAPGAGATTVNFNGGTLREINTNLGTTFFTPGTGTTTANVRNGGAVIDSNTFSPTIGQALVHSTIAGDNAIDGGLTKVGTGTLTLVAANTYTGPTNVNAGTLLLSTGSINSSNTVNVAASGALTLNNTTSLNDAGTLSLVSGTSTAKTTLTLGGGNGTTETIGSLILDGTVEPSGIYTAAQLAALDPNVGLSFISSGETLTVTAVPEPKTYLGCLLLIGGVVVQYRRRLKGLFASQAV